MALKVKNDVGEKSLFLLPKCVFAVKRFCGSTTLKKGPLLHVCARRIRLFDPKLMQIILLQRYDHEDVSGYSC